MTKHPNVDYTGERQAGDKIEITDDVVSVCAAHLQPHLILGDRLIAEALCEKLLRLASSA